MLRNAIGSAIHASAILVKDNFFDQLLKDDRLFGCHLLDSSQHLLAAFFLRQRQVFGHLYGG